MFLILELTLTHSVADYLACRLTLANSQILQ